MTIELTKEQEALLEKVIASGQFTSAEAFIEHALIAAHAETEVFAKFARAKLAEAQDDIDNGKVRSYTKDTHHELFDDIAKRGKERLKANSNNAE